MNLRHRHGLPLTRLAVLPREGRPDMREWQKSSPGHNVSWSLIRVVIRGTLPVYQMYISVCKLQPWIITLFVYYFFV